MSGISSYILSIAGIILLSVIVEFAMPEGSMNKYIKSVFGFFIVAVVIAPLPNILSTQNVSSIFEISSYELQEDYIYKLNQSKISLLENECKVEFNGRGYQNVEIEIKAKTMTDSDLQINSVFVDLSHIVISQDAEHKDITKIKEVMTEYLQQKLNVKKEMIIYET